MSFAYKSCELSNFPNQQQPRGVEPFYLRPQFSSVTID